VPGKQRFAAQFFQGRNGTINGSRVGRRARGRDNTDGVAWAQPAWFDWQPILLDVMTKLLKKKVKRFY
jgi:hypothetical protein